MEQQIRIIIIDDDFNDAEKIISAIKSGGWAVRSKRVENEADLAGRLEEHNPDIVMVTLDSESIDLERATALIREKGKFVPVIVIASDHTASTVEIMLQGAEDLVFKDNLEHLKLVVYRTYKSQQERKRVEDLEVSLNEAEKRCRTLLDSSRDSICYAHEGMHIYANDSYLQLFGYNDLDEIEGLPLMDLVSPDHQQTIKETLRNLNKAAQDNKRLDTELQHVDGKAFKAHMEFSKASIDGEHCTQILIREQGNSKELEEEIKRYAERDIATGHYNRNCFMEQLAEALTQASQNDQSFSLIQLQICNIQKIKDLVGPAALDQVVVAVAKTLGDLCQENEILARFGETDFAVLAMHNTADDLTRYLDKLFGVLEKFSCEIENKTVSPRICIGATHIDENAPDTNELLMRVEGELSQVKARDKGGYSIYVPKPDEMTQKQKDKLWATRLKAALQNGKLRLVFQPIVSLQGEPGERYEIYTRLLDEENQEISADEFLPSAERTGMAVAIDRWLLTNALKRLRESRDSGKDTICFIKLSVGSLQDPQFLPWLEQLLQETGIPADKLTFELKEEIIVSHLKKAIQLGKGLSRLQCKFAIDGFGTDQNSFQLVKAVSANYLRIDRILMQDIGNNAENRQKVSTISENAHSQDQKAIAPFVEDAAALSVLWGIGVDFIQGNFLKEASDKMDYDFSNGI